MATEFSNEKSQNGLFIPSLINTPIINFTKGRSVDEVYDDYKDQLKYSLIFGKGRSFASSCIIDAFLVEFCKSRKWSWSHLKGLQCYREPIEQRVPGIVFALESVIREEKITIIEEENYNVGKMDKDTRIINLFISQGAETETIIKDIHAIVDSVTKKVMKMDFDGEHGLQCFDCHKIGDQSFFPLHDISTGMLEFNCDGEKKQHKIENFDKACSQPLCKDSKHIVKRLAYGVSYICK